MPSFSSISYIALPIIALLCLMTLLPAKSALAADPPDGFAEAWKGTEAVFKKALQDKKIVGGSLMFVHEDRILGHTFQGMADRDRGWAVDEETIFHWGSITKPLTGIGIMQLRDRGLLKLDDPIVDYLPELRAAHNPYGDMKEITLRHLMSHSAGFRAPTWPWGGDKDWHPHEPTRWEQLVSMMPYTEIQFKPGSKFSYSNPAFIFLGRVIEELSGDDYEVYIHKNILMPLGMHKTYFDVTPYHLIRRRSNNYYVRDGEITANGLDFDTGITVSNSGLNTSLTEMAKYLSFLVGAGPELEGGHEILERSSLEEMWQTRIPIADEAGTTTTMGLSYFIMERDGFRFVGHTGSQKAFTAFFYIDPATRTAAIAAFNSVDVSPDRDRNAPGMASILMDELVAHVFPLFR